jgi:hypothetical protein
MKQKRNLSRSQHENPFQRRANRNVPLSWCVEKVRHSKEKSSLAYNEFLTLEGFPPETFEYRVRSALEGVMDHYPVSTDKRTATVPPFQGGEGFGSIRLGLRAARFTPGYHRTGFQPSSHGPSARYRVRSEGAAETVRQVRPVHRTRRLSGLKASNVTAWAEASPTSGGPGQPSPHTSQAL